MTTKQLQQKKIGSTKIVDMEKERARLIEYLKKDPEHLVKKAARKRLSNFSRYMQVDMEMQPFHIVYYRILDMFAQGKIKKLIVQMPPQHGKSEGSSRKLPSFMLGLFPNKKIAIGSYSTPFAQDFNRDNQRIIDTPEYHNLFPKTRLNGSNVVTMANVYLRNSNVFEIVGKRGWLRAVGRGGALTGKGVDVSILDDVYKDYAEGNSPIVRDAAWKWYTTVIRTRLHNDSQELIVFTRWHAEDVIGRLEKAEEIIEATCWDDFENIPEGAWIRLNFEALKTGEPTELDPRAAGEALWPSRHSAAKHLLNKKLDPVQFQCLFQGQPGGAEGRLYQHTFKTYTDKTEWGSFIRSGNYTDVADEGEDYLFSVCYDIYKSKTATMFNEKTKRHEPMLFALITDMIMTKDNTDVTTISVPQMMNLHNTQKAWIESNNGGAQFEKNIKKRVKAATESFYQGGNKESRIITASAMVSQHVIMPFDWENRYPVIYDHLVNFLRKFSANEHDDPEDGLTGVYEKEIANYNDRPYNQVSKGVKIHN